MRPILAALLATALPLAAHADVYFIGPTTVTDSNASYNATFLGDTVGGYSLSFLLPAGSLVGSLGGPVCSYAATCGDVDFVAGVFFPDGNLSQFSTGALVEDAAATALLPGTEVQFDLTAGELLAASGGMSLSGGMTGDIIIDTGSGQFVSEDFDFDVPYETLPTTSATPEPSSLILLGTGALSLAGAARRRFRRS